MFNGFGICLFFYTGFGEGLRDRHLSQRSQIPVLEGRYPTCLRCFLPPTHLIQMIRLLFAAEFPDEFEPGVLEEGKISNLRTGV